MVRNKAAAAVREREEAAAVRMGGGLEGRRVRGGQWAMSRSICMSCPLPKPGASNSNICPIDATMQAAARKREDDARRAREAAAVQAHREVERMRLEEQRKKIEAVCASLCLLAYLHAVLLAVCRCDAHGVRGTAWS